MDHPRLDAGPRPHSREDGELSVNIKLSAWGCVWQSPDQLDQNMVYIKLVLTMLFWGGTFIAGRIAAEIGPTHRRRRSVFAITWLL